MRRRAVLVYNPVAGPSPADGDREAVLAGLATTYDVTILETSRERDADRCAREALATRPDLVVAAGGDGTVSLVASALIGGDVPLVVVPRGPANSFARALGIPLDLEGALANARDGRPRTIDTARAAGRTVLLFASVGFHADTIGETSREAKQRWGALAYLASGLSQLAQLAPFSVELESEAEVIRCRATNVTVANLAPPTTIVAQGPASLCADDGRLDVTLIAVEGLVEAVGAALHLYRTARAREPVQRDDVGYVPVRRVTVRCDPPQRVLVDGEEVGTTPVTVECVPRSLRVLVPPGEREAPSAGRKLDGLPALEVEPR